jgi:DNA-binding response OmpR family regulator
VSAVLPPAVPSVLVADDDNGTRLRLEALVRELGHPVRAASDGVEAWRLFEEAPAAIVITDWLMPGMDGLELCSRIRQHSGEQSFVMIVTARDGRDDLGLALGAGIDDYVTKPLVKELFQARLRIAERRLVIAKERREAEAKAARLRWLAGIGQTVLTFQHELNNPLTALYGHLELLLESSVLAEDVRDEISAAFRQAERITGIVRMLAATNEHHTREVYSGFPMLSILPPGKTPPPALPTDARS